MKENPGGADLHEYVPYVYLSPAACRAAGDELAQQLEAQRPANPLAAQTVVVAHPGLQRWLLGRSL